MRYMSVRLQCSAHASDSPRESGESKGNPTIQMAPSPPGPHQITLLNLTLIASGETLSASCGSCDGDKQ